jgi:hypothetical protein
MRHSCSGSAPPAEVLKAVRRHARTAFSYRVSHLRQYPAEQRQGYADQLCSRARSGCCDNEVGFCGSVEVGFCRSVTKRLGLSAVVPLQRRLNQEISSTLQIAAGSSTMTAGGRALFSYRYQEFPGTALRYLMTGSAHCYAARS